MVGRPRRVERLVAALHSCRLVLITAPAGFGKTSLLMQALAALPSEIARAWMRAEPDSDLHALLTGIAEALDPLDPPWTVAPESLSAQAMESGGLPRVAEQLALVLQGCEAPKAVLAIDDLHRLRGPQPMQLLELLVSRLPATWTIVATTRERPAMRLSRWRVERLVEEFEQADLLFDRDEIEALIAQRGQSSLDARALLKETGGWAAGLAMRLIVDRAGGGPAQRRQGQRRAFEYLASEVLDGLPHALREFLLRCSVLDCLTAERCAAVTGDVRAAHWLDEIDRRGLFSSVIEGPELTLSLHDLFREFLRDRLARERPDEMTPLWQRAADTEPDLLRRLDLLQKAAAWYQAEDLLYEASSSVDLSDRSAAARLIDRFPAAWRDGSPSIDYLRGLALWWAPGSNAEMEHAFARAVKGFEAQGKGSRAHRARACHARALFLVGRFEDAEHLRQLHEHSPATDPEADVYMANLDYWMAFFTGPVTAPAQRLHRMTDLLEGAPPELWNRASMVLGILFFVAPGLRSAVQRFLEQARLHGSDAHAPLAASLSYYEAVDAINRADLPRALATVKRFEEESAWLGSRRLGAVHLDAAALQGQWDSAAMKGLVEAYLFGVRNHPVSVRVGHWLLLRALAAGDRDMPRRLIGYDKPWVWDPVLGETYPGIVEGRVALDDGRPDEARQRLQSVSARLQACGLYPHADIFVKVTLAVAELRCGAIEAAWQALLPVFELIQESGYVRFALTVGQPLLDELARADWRGIGEPEKLTTLAGWAEHGRSLLSSARTIAAPTGSKETDIRIDNGAPSLHASGLSHRELDVLERLAQGQSNKLIARELNLSPHTVKRHVARILSRLAVTSRGAAADWYRRAL